MREIVFVTGNTRKVSEATEACKKFGIIVHQQKTHIDEIQHEDFVEVAKHKAKRAFEVLGKPLVINDTSWKIPSLNGFPGAYMKDVAQWFSPSDFLNLMRNKKDRSILLHETVVFIDKKQTKIFTKEFTGQFVDKPKGSDTWLSLERVIAFNGKTLAEHHDKNRNAFSADDYCWIEFAEWFSKK